MESAELIEKLRRKQVTGNDLSQMVASGILSKSERRKITRLAGKEKKEMSERQILRAAVKEKKMMPKLSNEDRRKKYLADKLEQEREEVKAKFTVCLGCRVKGHFLKDCPNAQTLASSKTQLICFNCGSADHPLRGCPEPRGPTLPFATCFICKEIGHISRDCLYPQGGCCHICFQTSHLVRDCPHREVEKKEESSTIQLHTYADGDGLGGDHIDIDDFAKVPKRGNNKSDEDSDDSSDEGKTTRKAKQRRLNPRV